MIDKRTRELVLVAEAVAKCPGDDSCECYGLIEGKLADDERRWVVRLLALYGVTTLPRCLSYNYTEQHWIKE